MEAGGPVSELEIERFGGFGGFGLPGSRIRSRGRIAFGQLSAEDRALVEKLFSSLPQHAGAARDGFRYRLTLVTSSESRTIEVFEHDVPEAIRTCVHDELK